jgi:hypothetical protein
MCKCIFVQITAILRYCFDGLVLARIKPETPSGDELIAFFMKSGYEVHVILLPGGRESSLRQAATVLKRIKFIDTKIAYNCYRTLCLGLLFSNDAM